MKKNFKKFSAMGLASAMMLASAVPAFAAVVNPEDYTEYGAISNNIQDEEVKADLSVGGTSQEKVYFYNSDGLTMDNGEAGDDSQTGKDNLIDMIGAFESEKALDTEVVAYMPSTLSVKVPVKIVLDGTRGATNDADYTLTVKGDIPGDAVVNVVPNTKSDTFDFGTKAINPDAHANDFDGATGTGTFEMIEKAQVKAAITATINQADTTWTVADDTQAALATGVEKTGNVSVANLSAGEWSNDISFDIVVTK